MSSSERERPKSTARKQMGRSENAIRDHQSEVTRTQNEEERRAAVSRKRQNPSQLTEPASKRMHFSGMQADETPSGTISLPAQVRLRGANDHTAAERKRALAPSQNDALPRLSPGCNTLSKSDVYEKYKLQTFKLNPVCDVPADWQLESTEACCICLEHYKANDKVCYLPCVHLFHSACVRKWLKVKRICPVCQRRVQ